MNEPTHVILNGKKIIISLNLLSVFDFLQKIDAEISNLLMISNRLDKIREKILEVMGLCQTMSEVISKNNLDFSYTFSEDPALIAENLESPQLTRAEMITMFAYLETLTCLYLAYEHETCDEKTLMLLSKSKKSIKVINRLILTDKNEYYSKNRSRLVKVNAKQLRNLRNRLSHFFSVSGLGLTPNLLEADARKMELETNYKISFISPNDMKELLKFASLLLLKKWSDEYVLNKLDFERKILFVKAIVERDGPVLMYKKHFKKD